MLVVAIIYAGKLSDLIVVFLLLENNALNYATCSEVF